MTDQEIMQLAKEAGMFAMLGPLSNLLHHEIVILQRFATIVAEREREACAKVCDEQHDRARTSTGAARAVSCAAAIRDRSKKENQQ